MTQFSDLGLSQPVLQALDLKGYNEPTPIQAQAIPAVLEGRDLMGIAQTGTGKTAAFMLPSIDRLRDADRQTPFKSCRMLVLAPTRELAGQIAQSAKDYGALAGLKVQSIVGGTSVNKDRNKLHRGTDILVATPGRLLDLIDQKAFNLNGVEVLVLDEADQMLDLGFIHALRKIAPALGTPRQTMLFSATMPKQMEELSRAYLNNPKRVQVSPPGKAADKITQSVHFLDKTRKGDKLREILSADRDALTLVFGRTKHGCEKLMKSLVADGYNAASIHGNKSQGQRDRAIKAFRDGTTTILVATDVAARGIDIPGVAYVINHDLPETPDNYVHRIGRTARAGREGEAISLCSPEEVGLLGQIEKLMKIDIPVASGSRPAASEAEKPGRRGGGGGGRGRGRGQGKPQSAGKPGGQARRRRPRRAA